MVDIHGYSWIPIYINGYPWISIVVASDAIPPVAFMEYASFTKVLEESGLAQKAVDAGTLWISTEIN